MNSNNPMMDFSGFPRFEEIQIDQIEPTLDELLVENKQSIDNLVASTPQPSWNNFMKPLEQLDDCLERAWAPVSHLNGVKDSDELREAYQSCLPKLSDYASEVGQNRALFEKIKAIADSHDFDDLSAAQKKVIENDLRSFRLSGVELDEHKQTRYREISSQLSQLTNQYSQNVLDATDSWSLLITDEADLTGLPEGVIAVAKDTAEQAKQEGWQFSLQAPSFVPFMTYADNRDLRHQMYEAYVTRASDVGPNAGKWDNQSLMDDILRLRQEKAQLLGFENYAALSLETKMAENVSQVEEFLIDLATKSREMAENDLKELKAFAEEEYAVKDLQAWDFGWYSEKLRQKRYDFSGEMLRVYFPLPVVLKGLFEVVKRLFSIQVNEIAPPQVWHEDIQFFEILNEQGELRGRFYIDLYSRSQKRGGAWMAECINRRLTEQGIQTPVAFLTCNFTRPVDGKPSLLTHDEVMTLFHEFGHGLHHMLTQIDVAGVAGINGVPWDAVELPSQFLENWCWEREALDFISCHVDTGEPLPDDLLDKMKLARNFQSAMQMLRQVEFSLFDWRIHATKGPIKAGFIQNTLNQVRKEVAVIMPPLFNRFENSFSHIFAGGYAAGYYSYKWAEVLSADAFSRFEEEGIFNEQTGRSFLEHVLEKGGSAEPMTLFIAFRGRKPAIDALLRHSGLISDENQK